MRESPALSALYISLDGLQSPLGASQIVPYVTGLARAGVHMTVLSAEPEGSLGGRPHHALRATLDAEGIAWIPVRFRSRPRFVAHALMLAGLVVRTMTIVRRSRTRVVHARSYPAAVAGLFGRLLGARLLFDLRGFWVDERVDAGLWRRGGLAEHVWRPVERLLFRTADQLVVLSHAGAAELAAGRPAPPGPGHVEVVPTAVDLQRFRPDDSRVCAGGGLDVVYAGSIGTWYMLDEMLDFFAVLLEEAPGSSLTLLCSTGAAQAEDCARRRGFGGEVSVASLHPSQVPERLSRADLGLFFIRPVFSKKASCPTKLAEFLACGVPVATNAGVGDVAEIVGTRRVGVVAAGFGPDALRRLAAEAVTLARDPDVSVRCRQAAEEGFALEEAVARYLAIYRRLADAS